ncbi:MAG: EamA family transporter, partial [Actinobacteria bacterium]|nr:EamA family transporter [Actinomycetota bacterium]
MSDLAEPLTGITPAKQRHPMTGYLLYLAAAFLFALNGTVSKSLLLTGIEATRLSQIRVSSAFLLLLVLVAITRPAALRITKKELPVLLVYGVIGVGMTQFLYFVALQTLPVGVALLIEFTAPIMVALWFRFGMKQATRKSVWIALVLALTGLAMVAQVWLGFTLSAVGVTAGFGAAIALAIYYVLADKQLRSDHPRDAVSLTMWGFGASAIFWAIVQPWWSFPWASLTGI